jgi:flavodoxin
MKNQKSLFVYYSYTGNLESLIPLFKEHLNINAMKLDTVIPYSKEEDKFWERYHDEIDNLLTPDYKEFDEDLSMYNTIFLAFPNWSNTFPPAVRTFLSKQTFKNKKIIPIITHCRNGEVDIVDQIKVYTKGSETTKALVFLNADLTKTELNDFLREIKYV